MEGQIRRRFRHRPWRREQRLQRSVRHSPGRSDAGDVFLFAASAESSGNSRGLRACSRHEHVWGATRFRRTNHLGSQSGDDPDLHIYQFERRVRRFADRIGNQAHLHGTSERDRSGRSHTVNRSGPAGDDSPASRAGGRGVSRPAAQPGPGFRVHHRPEAPADHDR